MKTFFLLLLTAFLIFPASGQLRPTGGEQTLYRQASPRFTPDKKSAHFAPLGDIDLTPEKIEDLAVLGKVWGFLKYYHPAVRHGDYQWDDELLRILPAIIAAHGRVERNSILKEWVKSLGNVNIAGPVVPANVKLDPDLLWIVPRTLGPQLAKQLSLVRSAGRPQASYYLSFYQNGNPNFQNENIYPEMSYPDTGYRLLALYRYWNYIQYFYPNRHLIGESWGGVMTQYVPRLVNAKNETQYTLAILSLIGRINDTHANVWSIEPPIDELYGLNAAAVRTRFVEGKAVVTEYWNQTQGSKTGLLPGDVIESVDGKTIAQLIDERLEYYPASNYSTKLRDISVDLLRTNNPVINITYKRDGRAHSATLATYSAFTTIDPNLIYFRDIPPFSVIDNNIAYLYAGSLAQGQTSGLLGQIAPTRGLIIDLRCYPGDFLPFTLGSFVMPGPTSFTRYSIGNSVTPGLFTYLTGAVIHGTIGGNYDKKIVVLVNELTQSQAEYTALAFRASARTTIIGSTTAGADGDISFFYLPGGIRSAVSGIGIFYPDGRETQRVGIVPDIVMEPTIQGIKEGKDELLEKALEVINGK